MKNIRLLVIVLLALLLMPGCNYFKRNIAPRLSGCCFLFGTSGVPLTEYMKAHNRAAFRYYKEGDYITAAVEIKKVLELNAENPDSHYILGLIAYKRKDLQGALKSFQRSVNISPNEGTYRTSLGLVYDDIGEHETALKHHVLAIKKNPDLPVAHNNIAECYFYLGKYNLAWKHLKKAESLNYPVKGEFVKKVLHALKGKKN